MGYLIIIAIVAAAGVFSVVIVPQAQEYVVERLGEFKEVWQAGTHFKVPFIDKVVKKVTLKEQAVDFPLQPIITKDNITLKIDVCICYRIADAKKYVYSVENPVEGIENLITSTLRLIVSGLEMDNALESREYINVKMMEALGEVLMRWGIKVIRVEVNNIIPPEDIADMRAKVMKAEYERRELL